MFETSSSFSFRLRFSIVRFFNYILFEQQHLELTENACVDIQFCCGMILHLIKVLFNSFLFFMQIILKMVVSALGNTYPSEEAIDSMLNVINCDQTTSTIMASKELLTSYKKCVKEAEIDSVTVKYT